MEHDESFSSPSDNVLRIDSVGGTAGGYRLILEDGSSFFVLPRFLEGVGFSEGDELSVEEVRELASLAYRSELEAAEHKAIEFLARREHTALQIEQKLLKRNFSRQVIQDLLPHLTDTNRLNEERYASEWLRVRMRRNPIGPAKAVATLREHGVPEGVIRAVLTEYEEEHPGCWVEAAARSVRKMPDRGKISREKCVQRLYRRGFSRREVDEIDIGALLG